MAMHQDQIRADLQQAVLNGVNRRFVRDLDSERPLDPTAE
jgi:hypothetical protein